MRGKGRRRESTRTSEFGVSSRENHDSSKFYSRRLYDSSYGEYRQANVNNIETAIPVESLDKIFCKSSERMDELPDNSIHLAVTSPPYNVGKEYDGDLTIDQYRELLRKVFLEIYRVIADGGRVCINVANLGRKPYIPLHSHVIQDMLACGFLMRGEIIWNKGPSAGASTAWGSWQSASNPTLRDVHEYVLVFSKGSFSRRKAQYPRRNSFNTLKVYGSFMLNLPRKWATLRPSLLSCRIDVFNFTHFLTTLY
jgi:modification methylase